jgi:hypothetical protein
LGARTGRGVDFHFQYQHNPQSLPLKKKFYGAQSEMYGALPVSGTAWCQRLMIVYSHRTLPVQLPVISSNSNWSSRDAATWTVTAEYGKAFA